MHLAPSAGQDFQLPQVKSNTKDIPISLSATLCLVLITKKQHSAVLNPTLVQTSDMLNYTFSEHVSMLARWTNTTSCHLTKFGLFLLIRVYEGIGISQPTTAHKKKTSTTQNLFYADRHIWQGQVSTERKDKQPPAAWRDCNHPKEEQITNKTKLN